MYYSPFLFLASFLWSIRREERRSRRSFFGSIAQENKSRKEKSIFSHELILKQSFLFSVCAFTANLEAMSTIIAILLLLLITFGIVYGQNQITGK